MISRFTACAGKFRPSRTAILVVILMLTISSCGSSPTTWEKIEDTGKLRVGLDPTYPPFESMAESGVVGIDMDLAEAITGDLDLELDILHFGYDGLYDALLTKQVDVLISALTIIPERTKDFAYTDSYFDAGQYAVFPEGLSFQNLGDIETARIAVELGSEGHVIANQLQRSSPLASVTTYRSADEALQSLMKDENDVAITDGISGRLFIKQESALHISDQSLSPEPYAIVVRAADEELLAHLNASIEKLKNQGALQRILERWLDSS